MYQCLIFEITGISFDEKDIYAHNYKLYEMKDITESGQFSCKMICVMNSLQRRSWEPVCAPWYFVILISVGGGVAELRYRGRQAR